MTTTRLQASILLGTLLLCAATAFAAPVGREVDYRAGATTLKGYLASDPALSGKRPGILVVHEWWGHNAYARKRADMLAALGYTALAVDMYGEGKTAAHPKDAGKFASEIRSNLPLARERFLAALTLLRQQPTVAADKVAAIGYCFGGAVVLAMARDGVDLAAVVSFHGSLGSTTPAQPGKVKARVQVYNGAEDPFVTAEEIAAFKAEMEAAGVNYRFINLPGASHSFTNPEADAFGQQFSLPLAYHEQADRDSWQGMLELFHEIF